MGNPDENGADFRRGEWASGYRVGYTDAVRRFEQALDKPSHVGNVVFFIVLVLLFLAFFEAGKRDQ